MRNSPPYGFSVGNKRDDDLRTGHVALFKDKDELFTALVKEGADRFAEKFMTLQQDFKNLPGDIQIEGLFDYSDDGMGELNDILYRYFDAFKLIVCFGGGSSYENYTDRLVDAETQSTFDFIRTLKANGHNVPPIKEEMCHMLASASCWTDLRPLANYRAGLA